MAYQSRVKHYHHIGTPVLPCWWIQRCGAAHCPDPWGNFPGNWAAPLDTRWSHPGPVLDQNGQSDCWCSATSCGVHQSVYTTVHCINNVLNHYQPSLPALWLFTIIAFIIIILYHHQPRCQPCCWPSFWTSISQSWTLIDHHQPWVHGVKHH